MDEDGWTVEIQRKIVCPDDRPTRPISPLHCTRTSSNGEIYERAVCMWISREKATKAPIQRDSRYHRTMTSDDMPTWDLWT